MAMVCVLVSGGLPRATAASQAEQRPFADAERSFSRFVIADFDGDAKPDFATVEADQFHIRVTDYSIHLRLSRGSESAIGLTARSGGLQLFSRDVNGDDHLDLVVRTTLDSNLVAVLINDGHGNFTLARPELFPGLEKEPEFYLRAETVRSIEPLLLLPLRNALGEELEVALAERVNVAREPLRTEEKPDFCDFSYQYDFGRAPPQRP
jgi:hypothetical protein